MYKRGFVFAVVFGVFLISFAFALPQVTIDVKPVFNAGEKVLFSYQIFSDVNENAVYRAFARCDENIPVPFAKEESVNLTAGVSFSGSYEVIDVNSALDSGNCNATVSIISSGVFAQKPFRVETTPKLNVNINLCKDSACSVQTIVFKKGDKIYLSVDSNVPGISTSAKLTRPDGIPLAISLPSSIDADMVGAYTVEISASKSGYGDASSSKQFAVINSNANIQYAVESDGENSVASVSGKNWINSYLIYLVLGLIVLVVIAFVIKIVMRKPVNEKQVNGRNVK